MDGDSAVDLQEIPVFMNCRILFFRSQASNNKARAVMRKPVHTKHGRHPSFPRGATSVPTVSSEAPVPPPVIEMVETVLEFEEDEEDCSTHSNNQSHHFNLTSPLHQFQSPAGASILLHHLQSPMSCSHPLPPVNTPSTGEGQAALLHSWWLPSQLPTLQLSLVLPSR